jgi:hypothetical protein
VRSGERFDHTSCLLFSNFGRWDGVWFSLFLFVKFLVFVSPPSPFLLFCHAGLGDRGEYGVLLGHYFCS